MSEVFSGRHGNPDAAFVEACRTVESVALAVVWAVCSYLFDCYNLARAASTAFCASGESE